jgi:hypothetical protein
MPKQTGVLQAKTYMLCQSTGHQWCLSFVPATTTKRPQHVPPDAPPTCVRCEPARCGKTQSGCVLPGGTWRMMLLTRVITLSPQRPDTSPRRHSTWTGTATGRTQPAPTRGSALVAAQGHASLTRCPNKESTSDSGRSSQAAGSHHSPSAWQPSDLYLLCLSRVQRCLAAAL